MKFLIIIAVVTVAVLALYELKVETVRWFQQTEHKNLRIQSERKLGLQAQQLFRWFGGKSYVCIQYFYENVLFPCSVVAITRCRTINGTGGSRKHPGVFHFQASFFRMNSSTYTCSPCGCWGSQQQRHSWRTHSDIFPSLSQTLLFFPNKRVNCTFRDASELHGIITNFHNSGHFL